MMLTTRLAATVVTATTTFRGHRVEVYGSTLGEQTVTFAPPGVDEPTATVTEASFVERSANEVWRVTGVDQNGEPVIWKVFRGCSCHATSVYPTPVYDVPT